MSSKLQLQHPQQVAIRLAANVIHQLLHVCSPGSYIANRTSDKLTPVAEKIYTCRSGSAADTQALSDYVRHYLVRECTQPAAAAAIICTACACTDAWAHCK